MLETYKTTKKKKKTSNRTENASDGSSVGMAEERISDIQHEDKWTETSQA